jgi:flagellar hook-associated protein 1 FlgK
VEGNSFWTLTTQIDSSGLQHIFWNDKNGNPFDISTDISNGELKGLLEVRDVEIPNYLNKLDRLSGTIIADVNALHQGGYGLDGSTLIDFFSGSTASDIAVNPEIVRNINKIAAAGSYDILPGDKPGDNSNSIAIGNLQNSKAHNPLLIGGSSYTMDNATFDDTYGSLVWEIGNNVQQATFSAEHQSAMLSHLNNYRESVSGVSLDEEMVSLIKFQHAYEAAAKLITTADELLNTIINMV